MHDGEVHIDTGLVQRLVAAHVARGTTRLVVGPAFTDLSEQKDQISAFAARQALLR